jgi:hypothetical protein
MKVNFKTQPPRQQPLISETPFHEWSFSDGVVWTQFYRQSTSYLLRFPGLADFEISRDGDSVCGRATPDTSPATFEHLFLNQVLPLARSRQDKLVLHASAVDLNGMGVAFVGESGRGKSTLAASFASAGARFLTDDGLYLEWKEDQCWIIPSHPSIRLWDDSQNALISESVTMAPALDFTSKSRFMAGDEIAYCDEPRPLRRVYFLGAGDVTSLVVERLRPAEAMLELAQNFFLLDMNEQEVLARHFDGLCRLAALPVYFRLDYPRYYEDLPSVRETITQHAFDVSVTP